MKLSSLFLMENALNELISNYNYREASQLAERLRRKYLDLAYETQDYDLILEADRFHSISRTLNRHQT
jgi:hypothetical protein